MSILLLVLPWLLSCDSNLTKGCITIQTLTYNKGDTVFYNSKLYSFIYFCLKNEIWADFHEQKCWNQIDKTIPKKWFNNRNRKTKIKKGQRQTKAAWTNTENKRWKTRTADTTHTPPRDILASSFGCIIWTVDSSQF